jgi:protein TonB
MDGTALAGDALLSPQPELSPGSRRALPLAVTAAALAHAAVFALLLIAPGRVLPEPESVTYDLVFVEPAAPPAPIVAPVSAPPFELPQEPPPVRAAEPPPLELPTPAPPKPRPVAKAPAIDPTPDDQPARAGEPTAPASATTTPAPPAVAVASPPVASAPARAAADPAYAATLLTWLNRYKDYPWQARRRGVEGRVILFVVVERNGKVADLKVASSSGAEILDEAALTMVRRGDPMPPIPSSMTGDVVQFWVPIDFALSR